MTALEKLRHLRSLAAKATPRPWEGGACEVHAVTSAGKPWRRMADLHGTTGEAGQESDNARYIAAAANLLPALVQMATVLLIEVRESGKCCLCGAGHEDRRALHYEDCPVLLLERALEADRG